MKRGRDRTGEETKQFSSEKGMESVKRTEGVKGKEVLRIWRERGKRGGKGRLGRRCCEVMGRREGN